MVKAMKVQFRVVSLLMIVALVISGLVFAQPTPASAQGCFPYYIVKAGDSLYRIALAAGTNWQTLAYLNGITNPNRILVGQRICLPPTAPGVTPTAINVATVTPRPTLVATATFVPGPTATTAPSTGITLPPPGVFPSFNMSTYFARIGDTLTLTGINFPTNESVDIYFTNMGTAYPNVPSGSAVISATGTLSTSIVIPPSAGLVTLNGSLISVLVRGRVTGYYGYNYFTRLP
ncbi:MAG: LysM peptidoglycan-binding domain-containing protein [Anaerolineae bacterium]|nr:LysM peptidoglycan-binding domain-containing protein [Anaerolineae bacterium]